jgi:branched-subunit amino acid ABC-type transport system permease component
MLGAFTYWQLRFGWHWSGPVSLIVVLVVLAPLLGAALYLVIMRGLRGTAEVAKIVVPISVMLGFLALSIWIWDPTPRSPRIIEKFFGNNYTVSIFNVNITWHELIAVGLAVVIAVALRFLFFRTRTGVSMRAVVDDPALLRLTGGRPERLATLSWAMGAALAALSGILITPIQGGAMSADALTLLVIDAFAAAMFGRLRSLPRTFVGALILGLASNYVVGYFPDSWTWTGSFRISLPMIFLFVVLLVLPQDRLRGSTQAPSRERFRLPSVRTAVIAAAIFVGAMYLLMSLMEETAVNSLAFGMTLAIVALSLVLLTGFAGEINLAALSFGAIGTIVVFHFGVHGVGPAGRTTIWGYLLAMVVCAAVGALVALPALRLRGLYLALATMAFGVFVSRMVLTEIGTRVLPIIHLRFSIFPSGTLTIPRLEVGPLDLKSNDAYLMFLTIVFVVLGILLVVIRHSSYGRRLAALKDSPAASATLGMNVVRLKLSVFMLSAAIAGLGGALMSAQLGSVDLDRFDIFLSLSLLMLTVVGGIGYVSGALFGGVLLGVGFVALQDAFTKLGTDHATLVGVFAFLATFTTILPAITGIGVAREPNGVADRMVREYSPLRKAVPLVVAAGAAEAIVYGLAYSGQISSWWFVVLTVIIVGALPAVAKVAYPRAYVPAEVLAARREAVPPELIGIDRPFTDRDRVELERALGLDAGAVPLPANGRTNGRGRTLALAREVADGAP